MNECLQTEPSKRITFNHIVSHLLPSMSAEFQSVSYYCTTQCGAAAETDVQEIAASSASVQLKNSVSSDCTAELVPSEPFHESVDSHVSVVNDESAADSDVDGSEAKSQCTSVGSGWQQQQRPLPICDSRSIRSTVNGGLAYHRLPAAC